MRYSLGVSIRSRLLELMTFDSQAWGVPIEAADGIFYMDAGHVDSLQIIGLIIDVEDEFDIILSSEDTESDEFRTLGGLSQIVARKVAAQGRELPK